MASLSLGGNGGPGTAQSLKDWPFPKKFNITWRLSKLPIFVLGHAALKFYLRLQQVQTKNLDKLRKAVLDRPKGTPLVTVSNHSSCIDDPVIFAPLPMRCVVQERSFKWTPAAKEICFTNKLFATLLARSQIIPIVRGDSVYQKAVNFCIDLLNDGNWIHIFPEGKVNTTNTTMRLKWGAGRMIAEAKIAPIVLPIWHIGMDEILPNKAPYIPQFFKKLTLVVGEPLDLSGLLHSHSTNALLLRKKLTERMQEAMKDIKIQAETMHQEWKNGFPIGSRAL